jgi:alkylation response protein AidB-like acyl-CoA dehydrogenase
MDDAQSDLAALAGLLAANAPAADRSATFPADSLQALRKSGYLGLMVPVEYGGMGGQLRQLREVAEVLAGGCLSTALIWAMHCQQVDLIVRHADTPLRESVLPRVAAGDLYLGSVTTGATTRGDLARADDRLIATGEQIRIERIAPIVTGGLHADAFLITMEDDQGITLLYADRSALTVTQVGDWRTLGMRATESVPLRLEGWVTPDAVVGQRGQFATVSADSMVPAGHIAWSACWLGAAQSVFSQLVRRLARVDGAAGVRESTLLQERVARIRVDLELVSAYLGRVVDEVEGVRAEGGRMDTPARQIHLNTLKIAASELTFGAVDRMVQLGGLATGYGTESPVPLERTFRDLRSAALNFANDKVLTINGKLSLADRAVTLI